MNNDDKLMTMAEAVDWKFCERCGKELEFKSEYRYSYETGERYEDSRMKLCPRRLAFEPDHTRIELLGVLDVVPA